MSSHLLENPVTQISSNAIISANPDQIASELDGEAVILNMTTGIYYGLNTVGARIWALIQQPKSFEFLHHTLIEEYDVSPEVCKEDLLTIISDMARANLVEVSREEA